VSYQLNKNFTSWKWIINLKNEINGTNHLKKTKIFQKNKLENYNVFKRKLQNR
jgi:hypothetical protein